MRLLDQTIIRDSCDYSFGDQSGEGFVTNWHMKMANINNQEFLNIYETAKSWGKKYITLFIDNVRLYKRPGIKYTAMEREIPEVKDIKDRRVAQLCEHDLLDLCSKSPDMKFVIFSGFEDTPIDEEIFDKIPSNVLAIFASNAISFGGKVHPIPYGLQRKLNNSDQRHEIVNSFLTNTNDAHRLLYINHSTNSNKTDRCGITDLFYDKNFATVETKKLDHYDYFNEIKKHRFMICPPGNAIGCDCHRDWEVLYMRRVPIVLDSPYLRTIFDGLPVLFVKSWNEITENLLLSNNNLYEQAKNMDMKLLDQDYRLNDYISKILSS